MARWVCESWLFLLLVLCLMDGAFSFVAFTHQVVSSAYSQKQGKRKQLFDTFAKKLKLLATTTNNITSNDKESTPSAQPHEQNNKDKSKPKGSKFHPKRDRPRLPILAYHNSWVCINKPAGMTVHRSHRQSKFELVVSTTLKRQLRRKVSTVHRLDHRTSGALLFAFNAAPCAALHSALRHETSRKMYVALLRGNWHDHFPDTHTATMSQPLTVDGVLKSATTSFTCLSVHDKDNMPCSLVTAQLVTGRWHQIRRHAWHLGMPVLGDTQHGDTKVNRAWRKHRALHRLALHAWCLDNLPLSSLDDNGGIIDIVAPLPTDLRRVLEQESLAEMWKKACDKEPRLATPFIDIRTGTLGIKKEWQNRLENDDNDDTEPDAAALTE